MKRIILFSTIILFFSCSSNLSDNNSFLLTSDLPTGEFVKNSGKKLINRPFGFTKIISDSAKNDNALVIAVHGYDSRGYEWVTSLNKLANNYNNTYFYRYDWNICPDSVSHNLAESLATLLQNNSNFSEIIIFGHSYGGLVVTYLASNLDINVPIEIHTIAAPLAGYPRIMDNCDLQYNDINKLDYPIWNENISHHQWRTQKQQDGLFRDMEYDPQDIKFDDGEIILLPQTMNGQRLGHNWSITWVINNYHNIK